MTMKPTCITDADLEQLASSDDPRVAELARHQQAFRHGGTMANGRLREPFIVSTVSRWWHGPRIGERAGQAVQMLIETGRCMSVELSFDGGITVRIYPDRGQSWQDLDAEVGRLVGDTIDD